MEDIHAGTRTHRIQVREIFERGSSRNQVFETLSSIACQNCQEENKPKIKHLTKNFVKQFLKKWTQACRIKSRFFEKNLNWLNNSVILTCSSAKGGRPKKSFENLSYCGKYKRTKNLRNVDTNELLFASKMGLRSEGKAPAAKRLSNIELKPEPNTKINRLTDDNALAMLIDARLSKRQYQNIRDSAKENMTDIYPPYNHIREAKKRCYPENIIVTEHSVSVSLQSLLDHTTRRLLSTLELEQFAFRNRELILISKWGMDGSSGQAEYKQAFETNDVNDSNLLLTCVVPIQLYTLNNSKEKIIIWNNPFPCSTKLYRPLKMQFLKETIEISKRESQLVKEEISNLQKTQFNPASGEVLAVKHDLHMTMLDMKMINSLTDTSSQKCYLCGASPVEMNNLEKIIQKPIVKDNLQYGITSLHAWIRCFECLLKISYKMPIQKWQARGEDKNIVKKQKFQIQSGFKKRVGLIVDQPKQGAGTSNDGNCARAFFRNYSTSAEITGIDQNLIYRLFSILQVIASGFNIKLQEFSSYTIDTARKFVSLYPWYRMPVGVHKILLHGAEIISAAPVPIGQLSEEAQEARNKEYRRYREHNSRKCSRTATNMDVFHLLCVSSDPLITTLRKKYMLKKRNFTPEALSLLESHSANPLLDDIISSETDSE